MTVFERLTQNLENLTGKLRELVEKQNAVMGKRDLARHRIRTAAYESY